MRDRMQDCKELVRADVHSCGTVCNHTASDRNHSSDDEEYDADGSGMRFQGDDGTQGNHNRGSMNRSKDSTAQNTPSSKYLSNRHEAT